MKRTMLVAGALALLALVGCASGPQVSSNVTGTKKPTFEGKVFISQQDVPGNVEHEVIGTVEAEAKSGYDSVESLYPYLADEARKLGANAVIGVDGGRKPSLFSWAAPFASGKAIRVESQKQLEKLEGSYY